MRGPSKQARVRITPLPRRVGRASRVVVFGGSFDPPHRWHIAVASAARRRAGEGAWVLFVPAARSPLKNNGPRAADADRLEMLRLAIAHLSRAAVWTDEMDRASRERRRGGGVGGGGPSYTVDTLRRLREQLPKGAKVWLLMGSDQAAQFHLWREYRAIMEFAEPLVVLRPPMRSRNGLLRAMRATGAWSDEELAAWARRVVRCGVREVSSTEARALASGRGERRGGQSLRTMVPARVAEWIERRGVYRDAATGAAAVLAGGRGGGRIRPPSGSAPHR